MRTWSITITALAVISLATLISIATPGAIVSQTVPSVTPTPTDGNRVPPWFIVDDTYIEVSYLPDGSAMMAYHWSVASQYPSDIWHVEFSVWQPGDNDVWPEYDFYHHCATYIQLGLYADALSGVCYITISPYEFDKLFYTTLAEVGNIDYAYGDSTDGLGRSRIYNYEEDDTNTGCWLVHIYPGDEETVWCNEDFLWGEYRFETPTPTPTATTQPTAVPTPQPTATARPTAPGTMIHMPFVIQ